MRTLAYYLALVLVFLIPFEKMLTFGGRSGPTLTHYFGLFVAAFWLAAVLLTDRFRKPQLFHLVVLLFIVWNAASVFWSISPSFSTNRLATYIQLGGLVLVLWDLFTTPPAVRALLQAYVFGAWVSAASTAINFLRGITAHEHIVRYSAGTFNENELSLVLALGMPMAWYLTTLAHGAGRALALRRVINYLYVPLSLFAILLTASRGGLLCAVPASLYILSTFKRLRLFQRVLLSIALISALYAVHSLVPESSYARLADTADEIEGGGLNGRVEVWELGLAAFAEKPIYGVGTGAFQAATVLGRAAHNAYLSVLVETGMVGIILFLSIILLSTLHALRLPGWQAWFYFTLLLVWTVGVVPLSLEARKPTWVILGLPVLAANAYLLERLKPSPVPRVEPAPVARSALSPELH